MSQQSHKKLNPPLPLDNSKDLESGLEAFHNRLSSFLNETDYMLEISKIIMQQNGKINVAQAVTLQSLAKKISPETVTFCTNLIQQVKIHYENKMPSSNLQK